MNRLLLILVALQLIGFLSVSALFKSSPKLKHATKFRLKQKVLTLGSSYTIEDEHGKPAYKVGFKTFGLGKHLSLTDPSGHNEYCSIKHVLNPLGLAKYEIRKNNKVFAEVNRKMNLFGGKKFKVKSEVGELTVEGNFRSREFKIKRGHKLVSTISKKFFAIGDSYGVKIEEGEDKPFHLCLAIVVDEVAHD